MPRTVALRGEIRHEDIASRWGGEEFVFTVPDVTTDEDLLAIAERIRRRLATICLADHTTLGGPAAATRV